MSIIPIDIMLPEELNVYPNATTGSDTTSEGGEGSDELSYEPSSSLNVINIAREIINDEYIAYVTRFVIIAEQEERELNALQSSNKLRSFIKHLFISNGLSVQYDVLFINDSDIIPSKHSVIEITSEMMKLNCELYHQHKSMRCANVLNDIVQNSELGFPEIEYAICGLVYCMLSDCVVTSANRLWYFTNNTWLECSSDGYLWNYVTHELITYLSSESASNIASHFKSVNVRSRMLKDLKLRLHNDLFEDLLDSKAELICMTNGILNTETCSISRAVPSDYVSVIAGVPYEVFDSTSSKIAQLLAILKTIFPDEDLLDFFILSCSSFLEGHNANKVIYIWWGTGNNAKSLIQTFVMKTFGEYCSTAPTSLITGKRTISSNATPDLCHIEKKLVVFLQEPNPDERIRAGVVKEMTGNDRMYTRQLFRSGKTMACKAKLVLVCNNIIEIPGMDSALKRRIVVLPFTSTFLDQREYNIRSSKGTLDPQSRMIDPMIEKQLLTCGSAFMYLLCRRHYESKTQNFNVPQIVQDSTEDFLTRNNYPLIFINGFMHYVSGSRAVITEVYEVFKEWFKRSYPSKRVADLEMFTAELISEGYKSNGCGIIENTFVSYNGTELRTNNVYQ